MRILKKTWQNRRDFEAVLICEHCNHEQILKQGYDDAFYHSNVLPKIKCKNCGKTASEDYQPMQTVYTEGMQI